MPAQMAIAKVVWIALKLHFKAIRFYDNLLAKIVKIGLPTGVQNIVISLSNVIVQSSVNSFGATVVASYAACNRVDGADAQSWDWL